MSNFLVIIAETRKNVVEWHNDVRDRIQFSAAIRSILEEVLPADRLSTQWDSLLRCV
jgi:hypothetical protein